ncbi:hypothetical protein HT576_08970 [Haloterrigena sp. SYSU A121-1]|uniref:Uncharacterized protein n=1 Tax=Haloterrigena gelatinilytica TaxID=2741724 RepID=A0A8J8KFM2_9EURY|nr:hypothetical protein [Haloterrigena gelatinilytica]NUB91152.1 hypothetical protein [Haloterrigena gelatinilytica]
MIALSKPEIQWWAISACVVIIVLVAGLEIMDPQPSKEDRIEYDCLSDFGYTYCAITEFNGTYYVIGGISTEYHEEETEWRNLSEFNVTHPDDHFSGGKLETNYEVSRLSPRTKLSRKNPIYVRF